MTPTIFGILLAVLAVATIGTRADEPEDLLGAPNAANHEFPFMAAILKNGVMFCGGALISNQMILTAAHCVHPLMTDKRANVVIVTGSNIYYQGGQSHKVGRYFIHKNWNRPIGNGGPQFNNFDIGAIKLEAPIQITANQRPIAIVDSTPAINTVGVIPGWGKTENGRVSSYLRKLAVKIVSIQECQRWYRYMDIQAHNLCVFRSVGRGICSGDSGSPLIVGGKLGAVVSGGIKCAVGAPDILTNANFMKRFINWALSQ
ncbi:chymotrypsin-2-like [Prorops nasuta]|uniref:chymotrypsin-2-like n=1 Tax=Prorops nasuta TaxID=863751 RepID=UPI0034CE336C